MPSMILGIRVCSHCALELPADRFIPKTTGKNSRHTTWCDDCRASKRDWVDRNKTRVHATKLRYKKRNKAKAWAKDIHNRFGMTPEDYETLLVAQNHACAMCFKPERQKVSDVVKRLAIDHDHETGEVRGLLCMRCNVILGILENDEYVERAEVYRRKAGAGPLTHLHKVRIES